MNLLVTGTSRGIGRSLAEHLLARGDKVWGLARSEQGDWSQNTRRHFAHLDATWRIGLRLKTPQPRWLRPCPIWTASIACAGLQGEVGPVVTADPARWSSTVRANLDGTFHALRAFHSLLERTPRRAKVICFSGGGATKPRLNFSAYGVAKTAIVRLVETSAAELVGQPIDLNAVAPGAINTRLTDEVIALGPDIAGRAEFEAAVRQKASGGGFDRSSHWVGRMAFVACERRNHRPTPERPLGPLGIAGKTRGRTRFDRRLHAAQDPARGSRPRWAG